MSGQWVMQEPFTALNLASSQCTMQKPQSDCLDKQLHLSVSTHMPLPLFIATWRDDSGGAPLISLSLRQQTASRVDVMGLSLAVRSNHSSHGVYVSDAVHRQELCKACGVHKRCIIHCSHTRVASLIAGMSTTKIIALPATGATCCSIRPCCLLEAAASS